MIEQSKIGLVLIIFIIIAMPLSGQDNPVPIVQDSVQSDSIQPVQVIDFSDSQLYVIEDVLEVMEEDEVVEEDLKEKKTIDNKDDDEDDFGMYFSK